MSPDKRPREKASGAVSSCGIPAFLDLRRGVENASIRIFNTPPDPLEKVNMDGRNRTGKPPCGDEGNTEVLFRGPRLRRRGPASWGGEVLALLGEKRAGKSTLMNILADCTDRMRGDLPGRTPCGNTRAPGPRGWESVWCIKTSCWWTPDRRRERRTGNVRPAVRAGHGQRKARDFGTGGALQSQVDPNAYVWQLSVGSSNGSRSSSSSTGRQKS